MGVAYSRLEGVGLVPCTELCLVVLQYSLVLRNCKETPGLFLLLEFCFSRSDGSSTGTAGPTRDFLTSGISLMSSY